MEVRKEIRSAIAAALASRRKDETFERGLGKVIRRRKLPFSDYVAAMGLVREMAYSEGISLDEAASRLVSEVPEDEGED